MDTPDVAWLAFGMTCAGFLIGVGGSWATQRADTKQLRKDRDMDRAEAQRDRDRYEAEIRELRKGQGDLSVTVGETNVEVRHLRESSQYPTVRDVTPTVAQIAEWKARDRKP